MPSFFIRNPRLMWFGDDDDTGGGDHNPLDVDVDDIPADIGGGDAPADAPADAPEGQSSGGKLGDDFDDLFDDSEDAPAEGDEAAAGTPEVTKNPSVLAVLDKVRETLPKGLHSLVIDEVLAPELTKAQQGFDKQMAEVAPWKEFQKAGVAPEDVVASLKVRQFILDNPDRALRDIATIVQTRGLNPAEILGIQQVIAEQQAAGGASTDTGTDAMKALLGDLADQVDLDSDPALKLVLQKVAQLEMSQREQQEAVQRAVAESQQRAEAARQEQEGQAIREAMGTVKEALGKRGIKVNEKAVLQYAIAWTQRLPEGQREVDPLVALKEGAREWLNDLNEVAKANNVRAPRIGGGRGGLGRAGDATPAPEPKTVEERRAAWVAKAEAGRLDLGA